MPHSSDIRRVMLPNGITLLMAENHALPIVSMYAMFQYGSRFENDAQAGKASMLGDMLDEGTHSRTAQEIALAVEETGARLGAFAGYSRAGAQVSALAEDFPTLLGLSADLFMNAAFPEERFAQRKKQRLAQLKNREDDARTLAADAFDELIYGTHPAHRPTVGHPETVAGLTVEDLKADYAKFFVPNNLTVAVAGDISFDAMTELVTKTFADWKPVENFEVPTIPEITRQTQPMEKFIRKDDKEQIHIYLGHLGVRRTHPDFYALLVMDVILGNSPGMTSRIPRILRDEQGLAYTTYASVTSTAGVDPGRFTAYIGTSPENREKALAGLRAEIERITLEPVSAEELAMAKAYLTGSFVFSFETNSQVAMFMIEAEAHKLGFDFPDRYPELINAVTVEDVLRVSREHLNPAALTQVVAGPGASGQ
jgi:zinc protease